MNRLKLHDTIIDYLTTSEAQVLLSNQDYRSISYNLSEKLLDVIIKDKK